MDVMSGSSSQSSSSAPATSSPSAGSSGAGSSSGSFQAPVKRGLAARASEATRKDASSTPTSAAPNVTATPEGHVPGQSQPAAASAEGAPKEGEKQGSQDGMPASTTIKEIDVNGRKVKFDVAKPELIAKKLVDLESGMRKAHGEKDQLKQQLAQIQAKIPSPEFMEKSNEFHRLLNNFETAAKAGMTQRAVDELLNGMLAPDLINGWLQRKLQHNSQLLNMSEYDKQAYLAQFNEKEALDADRYQVALDKAEIAKERAGREGTAQQLQQAQAEAAVQPAYQKHSFGEKFPRFDKMLWEETVSQLTQLEESGTELTKQVIDNTFAGVRKSIEQEYSVHGRNAAAQAVATQKDAAMTGILGAIQNGQAQVDPTKGIQDAMKSGNTKSAWLQRLKLGQQQQRR